MKKLNATDYEVLELISSSKEISRTELTKYLDLSPAAISKMVKKLVSLNLIVEEGEQVSTGGRPRKILKINKKYRKIIAVNFGAGFIDVSIAHLDGDIIETVRKTFQFKTSEKLKMLLSDEIQRLIDIYSKNQIIGIGLSINGVVDREKGISVFSPHLKWNNLNLKEYFELKYGIPVIVDNDVRSMMRAEVFRLKKMGIRNAMYLYVKDGIGSTFMINGEVFEGESHCAGEIGHYVIDYKSNHKCKCGKYGCLEAENSASIIKEKINWELEKNEKPLYNGDSESLFSKAENGDEPYKSVVGNSSREIGRVVGNVLNILDIGNIIIAGSILEAKKLFITNFEKGIYDNLTLNFGNRVNILTTQYGNIVEKYAAINLIIENLFIGKKLIGK